MSYLGTPIPWADEGRPIVHIDNEKGERIASLTPDEARALARELVSVADWVDGR